MMQLHVYQSIWGMNGLPWRARLPWTLEQQFERIAEAGFDGVSVSFTDAELARRVCALAVAHGLRIQASYFPTTVEGFATVFETIADVGREHVDHVNLQPNVRPRTVAECVPYLLGWQRLARQAGIPAYVETHRDRMTTDLMFTLDLLDAVPSLELTADLSHFLVGREFAWPIDAVDHGMIRQVLRHARAYHGRVASREQVQIQTSFEHHRQWVELFAGWWEWGFRDFRARAADDAVLTFTTELGPPQWYAITGADGQELSDRWAEALSMQQLVRDIWARIERETDQDRRDR
ncbi:sugar phosphate isomerase/epimerase family protein [Conexibacter sp. CPCC 206217]|uniref:sugar phosphate isomerase/epimerase family protein n=1 Tax=Conexibacter sp. CPCC 206217 TaxID=3064574 RepID=UPI00351C58A9